jgi:exosome complex component RRP4
LPYLVEKRQLVVPGELLAEGNYRAGRNTYQDGDKFYAAIIGLANYVGANLYVVALKGCYMPIQGDLIIGKVIDLRLSGWTVDINAPYNAMLFTSEAYDRPFDSRRDEMRDFLDVGDLIVAKVINVERTRDPVLTIRDIGLGKISHGRVVTINANKIPRLIGKKGSMVNTLKRDTGCHITIAQNGRVLVSGRTPDAEALCIHAIRTVEDYAHTRGLTNKISQFIKQAKENGGMPLEEKNE